MGKIISNGIEYVGLTNINGVFVDTDNVIVPQTSYSISMSYTATQDCIVVLSSASGNNTGCNVKIDNVPVGGVEYSTATIQLLQYYFLRKGQTISVSNSLTGSQVGYAVYGVQQGSTSQGSSGGIDYSTTEQKTGQKWINGKDIYQKTYAVDISASQTGTVLISDYDYIVKIEAVLNNNSFAFPIFTLASSDYFVAFVDKSTNLLTVLRDSGSSHAGIAYVTIQYTKSTT